MPDVSGRTQVKRRGNLRSLLLTVLIALGFSYFVVTTVGIRGDSMLPALHSGERALVPRFETWFHRLGSGMFTAGDIVFFPHPDLAAWHCPFFCEYLIKRVVATSGQLVELRHGQLFVDAVPQAETYLGGRWRGSSSAGPLTVPLGHVFVLGDNRGPYGSLDSRSFGTVSGASIVGRTSFVLWPLVRREESGVWRWNPRPLERSGAVPLVQESAPEAAQVMKPESN